MDDLMLMGEMGVEREIVDTHHIIFEPDDI